MNTCGTLSLPLMWKYSALPYYTLGALCVVPYGDQIQEETITELIKDKEKNKAVSR